MSDFSLLIKGANVHMTRSQLDAITTYAAEVGGTIEVFPAGFGTVRVIDTAGGELLYRPDGHVDRPG